MSVPHTRMTITYLFSISITGVEMSAKRRPSSFPVKNKSSRRECPHCNKSFSRTHIKEHVERCRDDWSKSEQERQMDSADADVQVDREQGSDSDGEQFHDYRVAVRRYVRQHLISDELIDQSDSDMDGEEWDSESDTDSGPGKCNTTETGSLLTWMCLFIATLQTTFMLPESVIYSLLRFIKRCLECFALQCCTLSSLAAAFPGTIYQLWKTLGIQNDNFTKYVICKKCYAIYSYDECILKVEGKEISATCSYVAHPNHPQPARRTRCGETLLKSVELTQGRRKLYPFKTYCYKSVKETLKKCLLMPGFERKCEAWRERNCPSGILNDIYDGRIWHEFGSEAKGNFLSYQRHLGLMLNVDWFQPFEHVQYSVGVIYAVVLNLPREERFKLENIMLIGIVPDMKGEPPLNTFIEPLVSELKLLWETGLQCCSFESPNSAVTCKVALMCVGCDIPATRKLCGFLGHSATLGCSKCLIKFEGPVGNKDYSGFSREDWIERSLDQHTAELRIIQKTKTQTEKKKLESYYGIRYSCLVELEYFDPIKMSVIDPMHNLYQGTAKQMIRIWQKHDVLNDSTFPDIQNMVDNITTPSNIGRIPRKISSNFSGFTADQWKNWTNIFSLFALKDVLTIEQLLNWRDFVLASRLLCSNMLTIDEVEEIDSLLIKFCKGVETLYGKECVTPNMHLHGHLAEVVKDYGPVYSFWLFSFERYNGHLGSLPNNNKSVEVQMMKRFLRDSMVRCIPLPTTFEEQLKTSVSEIQMHSTMIDSPAVLDLIMIRNLSFPTTPVQNQDWTSISPYSIHHKVKYILSHDDLYYLDKMYTHIYLGTGLITVPNSAWKCRSVSLGKGVFGTLKSRSSRSALITANWNAGNGKIVDTDENKIVPGVIEKILLHNLIVDGQSKLHLLVKVKWYAPSQVQMSREISPWEIWSNNTFDVFGESAFMPIQRIHSKFVQSAMHVQNRNALFICPINKRLDL